MKLFPILAAMAAIALASCGATTGAPPPEPIYITKVVEVPVSVPCVVDPGPDPDYPDTDEALAAAPNVWEAAKLRVAGRLMRIAREGEWKAAAKGCLK